MILEDNLKTCHEKWSLLLNEFLDRLKLQRQPTILAYGFLKESSPYNCKILVRQSQDVDNALYQVADLASCEQPLLLQACYLSCPLAEVAGCLRKLVSWKSSSMDQLSYPLNFHGGH